MKKSILVAIAATTIIISTNKANAQKGFMIGTEGTPQLSALSNKNDMNNSSFEYVNTLSGSFGLSAHYGFTKNLGVGLNALYSYQGQQYKLHGIERIKKVEYLKIPLMFTYTYDINSTIMFVGKIGPQLGLLTNAKLTDIDGNNIVSDQKDAYEDYDIEGVVSAGIAYKLTDNFFLDTSVRFDYGFTDAENKDYTKNINNPSELIPINGYSINKVDNTNRATTNNMSGGLTIGIRYLFAQKTE